MLGTETMSGTFWASSTGGPMSAVGAEGDW